jgi:hypothetical protein
LRDWSRHSGDYEDSSLLGYYDMSIGVYWSLATDILVNVGVTIFLIYPEDGSSKNQSTQYRIPKDLRLQFISYFLPFILPFFWEKILEVTTGVFAIRNKPDECTSTVTLQRVHVTIVAV